MSALATMDRISRNVAVWTVASFCIASGANAQLVLTDAQVQAGYEAAIAARMEYRPAEAEAILQRLIEARPNAPQLRFDLAVSQAEQGRCSQASRTFFRGSDLAGVPSFERAAEVAMSDLCPRLAPFETEFGLSIGYDTNINRGASGRSMDVNGVPVALSGDAVASKGFGYTATAGIAYNYALSQSDYIVPSAALSFTDREGSDHDQATLLATLSYRHRGDDVDWRSGPSLKWMLDDEGLAEVGVGGAGRLSWTLSPRIALYANVGVYDVESRRNELDDHVELYLGATYVRVFEWRNAVARLGLSYQRSDYDNDLQDLMSIGAEVGVSGTLTKRTGFDLSLEYVGNEGRVTHPFFGKKRADDIVTARAQISLAQFDAWYGRPYLGVQHSVSESSFATKDFNRTSMTLGFTRKF
ncbi:MAG: hypothetical protein V2I43_22270 [Parvularcula sp.]|jgi:hypothetical protein|nr:hypothetical protein [Parvularcula sp.]